MIDHAKTEPEAIRNVLEYFGCAWIPGKEPM